MTTTCDDFAALLDRDPYESELHTYLATHPEILQAGATFREHFQFVTKPSIHRFQIDFALSGYWGTASRREWTLVEIERSTHKLFTRSGNPSAALTHALRQILDWRQWIEENLPYARTILPQLEPIPSALIVIGRRATLSTADQGRMSVLLASLYKINIRTYDYLLELCRGVHG